MWETTPYIIRTYDQILDIRQRDWGAVGQEPFEFLRYVVRSKRTYSKEQPIPAASPLGGFKDTVSGKVIGQTGFTVVNMADVSYKWCMVPCGWPPPPGWVAPAPPNPLPPGWKLWPPAVNPAFAGGPRTRDAYIGTVNSVVFDYSDPEGYCFPVGTLLYTGWDEEVFYNEAGQRTANYTFKFKFKEEGWNKFLTASGEWREVSLDGTTNDYRTVAGVVVKNKPYGKNDFRNLFQWSATY